MSSPAKRRQAEDPDCSPLRLLELTADDNFFVRRVAAAHPHLPVGTLELWVRAGSTADLGGFGPADPGLSAAELERLALLGPWGARLAARHPAASADTLAGLGSHTSAAIRGDVARHPHAGEEILAVLLFDPDPVVRAEAVQNPATPAERLALRNRAESAETRLDGSEQAQLATLGAYGRRLLARRPELTAEECARLAEEADPEVRRALLAHPSLPAEALARAVEEADGELEVLARAATHPAATGVLLTWLALHGPAPVRHAATAHPSFPEATRRLLVRTGASPDLLGFGAPDPSLDGEELSRLAKAGAWARLLAARHPATSLEVLGQLLADGDPLVRSAAAVHPRRPRALFELLLAAGATPELDGFERGPRPPLDPASLAELVGLGPFARRLVARHPQAPPELLERLAKGEDPQVRSEVAAHPKANTQTLLALAADLSPAVRWAVARRGEPSRQVLRGMD